MNKIEEIAPVLECFSIMRSVMYFKECMGFECKFMKGEPINYALIERDGKKIHLTQSEKVNPACVFLVCNDFRDVFRECTNKSAKIVLGIKKTPGRTMEFKVRDPDNNLLVFCESPVALEQTVGRPSEKPLIGGVQDA